MHPNGKYAFVANSNADRVEVVDLENFEIVSTIATERIPDGLAIAL
jgi:YVTN family beta-propeller protein